MVAFEYTCIRYTFRLCKREDLVFCTASIPAIAHWYSFIRWLRLVSMICFLCFWAEGRSARIIAAVDIFQPSALMVRCTCCNRMRSPGYHRSRLCRACRSCDLLRQVRKSLLAFSPRATRGHAPCSGRMLSTMRPQTVRAQSHIACWFGYVTTGCSSTDVPPQAVHISKLVRYTGRDPNRVRQRYILLPRQTCQSLTHASIATAVRT